MNLWCFNYLFVETPYIYRALGNRYILTYIYIQLSLIFMEALGVNEDMLLVMGMVIGFSGLGQVRLTQIWMAVLAFVLKSHDCSILNHVYFYHSSWNNSWRSYSMLWFWKIFHKHLLFFFYLLVVSSPCVGTWRKTHKQKMLNFFSNIKHWTTLL